jgi:3-hydroxyacyl-[acyl-carrier protein] dehydratase/trans-2-decenoyl-[acyl-carrier protein] isomerase
LVGFYLGWSGATGRGRAFGVSEVKFTGMVTPKTKLVTYHIDIKRVINRQVAIAFADGQMAVDGQTCYETKGLRVGTIPVDA